MDLPPFEMERWQSRFEHRVDVNLSESGVEPFRLGELRALTGFDPAELPLGYVQTNGSEELRERIARLYPGAGPENVVVTTGGAEANFLALWHLLDPGDDLAVLEPTYAQTPGLAVGLGARVRRFHLEASRRWHPAPGAAAEAVEEETRAVVVTNPNNPTGAVLSPEEREEIVEAVRRRGAWLVADEVYAGAEVSGEETPSFWGSWERTVVTGSLSKAYGLPGLRLGWAVAPRSTAEALWAAKDYTTIAPTALSDALAARVLEPTTRVRVLERTRSIVRENLQTLRRWLDGRRDRFSYVPPEAGAICFVRYHAPIGSSALAERLRSEASVLVVPGDHFGVEGHVRIGFGSRGPELRRGLERIGSLMDGLAAPEA